MDTPSRATENEFWISSPASRIDAHGTGVRVDACRPGPCRVTHQIRPSQSGITDVTGSHSPSGVRSLQRTQSCGHVRR